MPAFWQGVSFNSWFEQEGGAGLITTVEVGFSWRMNLNHEYMLTKTQNQHILLGRPPNKVARSHNTYLI
jgi:hypothetical protein